MRKLGIAEEQQGDRELVVDWLKYLQENQRDYTLGFRELAHRTEDSGESVFGEFEIRWRKRIGNQETPSEKITASMNNLNPLFIPRNHRVEEAIRNAVEGDTQVFHELNQVLAHPFEEQPEFSHYAEEPQPGQRVTATFCGT